MIKHIVSLQDLAKKIYYFAFYRGKTAFLIVDQLKICYFCLIL